MYVFAVWPLLMINAGKLTACSGISIHLLYWRRVNAIGPAKKALT